MPSQPARPSEIIDLTQERCPMSLLLAKRASRALKVSQSLTFIVRDVASVNDMQSYFTCHEMLVEARKASDYYYLTITKE
ncbi:MULTISPECIES: sulfurtransferase TusA family protein [unclassified Vibrio]|uniref:sulfurtransferase TusA family protein n=1 Tax=unclassified Vibrio TaxID=2614977 RepID=UPI001E62B6D8|nr:MULTISPECIES: sulfurtransferase TusA family protein [unclassified Vibrio]